jgi:uncharacterized protein YecT (DUF1311 family)
MQTLPVIFLLLSVAALAQQAHPQANPCSKKAVSMSQMDRCADFEFKQSDAHLNKVYQKAIQYMTDDLARAEKEGDRDQVSYEQKGISNLKKAEDMWLSYRDAQCDAASQRHEGGSMVPLVYSHCMKTLTVHRIDDLKSVYEEGVQKLD